MPITYEGHFEHGVASGDPLSDSIVLWTRVTPKTSSGVVVESISCGKDALAFRVKYFVKNEEDEVVISGVEEALCSNDWTLKVDVVGLNGGVKYSYGFETNSFSSRLGTFRLFSSEQNTLKFAVFSCANFGYGYFNAYGHAASLDLDFSLFLGDYIYEYDPSGYHIVRQSEDLLPRGTRLDNITDYRKRYESYHKDPDLQALRASAPLIAAWDDHEFANDAYKVGAGNHDDSVDGPWEPRKQAAARVFEEWIPIRTIRTARRRLDNLNVSSPVYAINRTFDFGELARLTMVESRVTARTNPYTEDFSWGQDLKRLGEILDSYPGANETFESWGQHTGMNERLTTYAASTRAHAEIPNRTILGTSQLDWLREKIKETTTTWQIVGQQQVLQPCHLPNYTSIMNGEWKEILENATKINLSENPTLKRHDDTQNLPHVVSAYERRKYLEYLAAGHYDVVLNFDGWNGYVKERERFVEALRLSGRDKIVVLGGDSHNAWVGMLGDHVACEFDGPSTTSPGIEKSLPYYDPRMVSEAYVSTNSETGMKWADTSNRGYILCELSSERIHTEYIFLSDISKSFDGTISPSSDCGAAFEYTGQNIQDASCRLLTESSRNDKNIRIAFVVIISVTIVLSIVPLIWILRTYCVRFIEGTSSTRPFSALHDDEAVELPETPKVSEEEKKKDEVTMTKKKNPPSLRVIEI